MEMGRRELVVQSRSPRTHQFEIEAEDFQDDKGDKRRDKEVERRVVPTQVKSGMVGDRKSTATQNMGRRRSRNPGSREIQPRTTQVPEQ